MKSVISALTPVAMVLSLVLSLRAEAQTPKQGAAPSQAIEAIVNQFDGGALASGGKALDRDSVNAAVKQGSAAVPALLAGLKSGNYAVRWGSAEALAKMSLKTPAVIGGLVQATTDKEWQVRRAALEGLDDLAAWSSDTIRALGTLALDTEAPKVAQYLSSPPGIQNAAMLTQTYYSKDNSELAISILGGLGSQALPTLNSLRTKLKGDRLTLVVAAIDKIQPRK